LEEGVVHARSQTAMGDDRDECWFEVGKVVAMVMVSTQKCVEGGVGLRPKPETERPWLGLGCAVLNGN